MPKENASADAKPKRSEFANAEINAALTGDQKVELLRQMSGSGALSKPR
ncbi:MAG: hypothetical protein R3F11_00830 [Verrucomicrobiales bacterium]